MTRKHIFAKVDVIDSIQWQRDRGRVQIGLVDLSRSRHNRPNPFDLVISISVEGGLNVSIGGTPVVTNGVLEELPLSHSTLNSIISECLAAARLAQQLRNGEEEESND